MPDDADTGAAAPLLRRAASQRREVCCLPRDPEQRQVQDALNRCVRVPGLQANVPRNSPVLLQFLKKQVGAAAAAEPAASGFGALAGDARRSVVVVYALAFLTMAMMTTITPTLLLYLQHVGFASAYDIQFYVNVSVIGTAVPVFTHVLLAKLADVFGARRTMTLSCLAIALALLGMSCFTASKVLFALAYLVYSVSQSLRPLRTIVLSDVSPDAARTEVMSLHALMTPLGALFGPLVWLLAERYPGEKHLVGSLYLNRFTLAYAAAGVMALAMAAIVVAFLPRSGGSRGASSAGGSAKSSADGVAEDGVGEDVVDPEDEVLHVHMEDGRDIDVHPARFRRSIFLYFCGIMFLCNMSMGLYMVTFQPIMVMKGASGQDLGLIYEIISISAIAPPLIVAWLSKRLKDREILVIGLVAKIIGISLFLPLFGQPVRSWAVVTGFILLIKASIFFFTASMSLFTKLLGGGLLDGVLIGFLSSFSALGPALAQLFFADAMLKLFGGFRFGVFLLPVLAATALVLHPWFWARLDADREFNRRVREQYSSLHPQS